MSTKKVYRVTLTILDLDEIGPAEIRSVLENNHYPNHCMAPEVSRIEERDIGEWSDDHPLNSSKTSQEYAEHLFRPITVAEFQRMEPVPNGPDRPGRYAAQVDREHSEIATLNAYMLASGLAWTWEDQPDGPPETIWTPHWPCARAPETTR